MTPIAHRVRSDIKPSREAVQTYFQQGDLVPVYRTLLADLETPVSVYLKLTQNGQPAFLLESVEGGEQVGRYSFLGVNPKGSVIVQGDGKGDMVGIDGVAGEQDILQHRGIVALMQVREVRPHASPAAVA